MQIFILIYSFISMNWYLCKRYDIINRNVWTLWYTLYSLCRERRDVLVVFIEIIFSHGDVFDSNIKLFW